MEHIKIVLSVC